MHRIRTTTMSLAPLLSAVTLMAVGGASLSGCGDDGQTSPRAAAPAEVTLTESVRAGRGTRQARYGQVDVCVAEDERQARRIVHVLWTAPAALPRRLLSDLRLPADFEAVAGLVTEEQACGPVVCGADLDRHLMRIHQFIEAGFDHVHVHQVGADQEAFFRFYERDVLPRLGTR
jgi:hypothetical protein